MAPNRNLINATLAYIIMHNIIAKRKMIKKPKRWWITQLYQNRELYGGSNNLLVDLKLFENSGHFHNFIRMSSVDFECLINAIGPKIGKTNTNFRKCVSVKERLALTLRFLATGDSYSSMQYLFKISKQLISTIIPEVCMALVEVLKQHIQLPSSPDNWLAVSRRYEEQWNFPHCLEAIDGKHVMLQAPIQSGSEYCNYKSFFSIVLFALVDADYNFMYVDVGCQGRISDGGVFKQSELYKKLIKNDLCLPEDSTLEGRDKAMPFVFLGDDAFGLSSNIMKPSSGNHRKGSRERIFNYRLSRARRVVENVFGICSATFSVLKKPILLQPVKAQYIIMATVYLHNFLRKSAYSRKIFRVLRKPILLQPVKAHYIIMATMYLHNFLRKSADSRKMYTPPGTFDGDMNGEFVAGGWRTIGAQEMTSLRPIKNVPRRSTRNAQEVREEFTDYFCTTGRLHWQDYCA